MADSAAIESARALLDHAVTEHVFPAAVGEVGDSDGVLWRQAFGTLTFERGASPASPETIFDLASLTKPLATTSVILELVAQKSLRLDDPVATFFEEWRGEDREGVTLQDLLEHASGLAARLVDSPPATRREFEHDISTMRLEYPPRTRSLYSDLGFILLGFLADDRGGASLSVQFDRIAKRITSGALAYGVPRNAVARVAPTIPEPADPRRGRTLVAEVHDDYAAALGGIAGHAGLFGDVSGAGGFVRALLRAARGDQSIPSPFSPAMVARMTTRTSAAGSSRALGWDTMLPTSSCGPELSPAAFGHVGFTGTSLWIDPILDRYFVLLTNRACGGGTLEQMREVRRAFHGALSKI